MNDNDIIKCALEKFFKTLNLKQQKAVFQVNGAVLIVAGAGSGKTTVLINRIANILLFGNSYHNPPLLSEERRDILVKYISGEDFPPEILSQAVGGIPVFPSQILAVTFTNKAANELKNRLLNIGIPGASEVRAGTFHSICVRILRQCIQNLGYNQNFNIYDTDDTAALVKDICKKLSLDTKRYPPRAISKYISSAKNELKTPDDLEPYSQNFPENKYLEVYKEYQKRLKIASALDFDDIISLTVTIFEKFPHVLSYWQNRFKYVMADEYQDTNYAQYKLLSLLTNNSNNLCVVGDEDQSIYAFRGATIENIQSFEQEHKNSVCITLDQNYRSTKNILTAANCVIENNIDRKPKNLWSAYEDGELLHIKSLLNSHSEGAFVASKIMEIAETEKDFSYSNCAVLYRNNSQSLNIETALSSKGIPYKVVKGLKFYDRREVKDMLSYIAFIENPFDFIRLERIINVPKRKIGDATIDALYTVCSELPDISPIEICENADRFELLHKKREHLKNFAAQIKEIIKRKKELTEPGNILNVIIEITKYDQMLLDEQTSGDSKITAAERLSNIEELKKAIAQYFEMNPISEVEFNYSQYLENASLLASMDMTGENTDTVLLMTIHTAKGMEFENVFLIGAAEGIFPGEGIRFGSSAKGLEEKLNEERRLAYVAITRAKKRFFATYAKENHSFGKTEYGRLSRFIEEIPKKYRITETDYDEDFTEENFFVRKKREEFNPFKKQQNQQKQIEINIPEYKIGQNVNHKVFGNGIITNVVVLPGDSMLEIAFENVGTKKLMAKMTRNMQIIS